MFKKLLNWFSGTSVQAKAAIAASCSAVAAIVSAGTAIYQASLANKNATAPYRVALATAQTDSLKDFGRGIAKFSGDLHLAL